MGKCERFRKREKRKEHWEKEIVGATIERENIRKENRLGEREIERE